MEANEIREGQTYKLDGKIKTLCFADFSDYSYLCDNLQPIEITKTILLKSGFIVDEFTFRYAHKTVEIAIDIDDWGVRVFRDWLDIKIHYVHELQNLYFALTGKELKVKF